MTWVIVIIAAVIVVGGVLVLVARGRRPSDGVVSFQRHIDALSPEARRSVVDRIQKRRPTTNEIEGNASADLPADAPGDAPADRDDGGVDGS